ncbi:MAG TPA: histidine kinase, partial [Verrucomicrobiae bacterium]|nr:histidine kinase [Verrucomicrobiae bacterium]
SVVIMQSGDDSFEKSLQPAAAQKFRASFRGDTGIQRVYPWILFGPYVALLALYFPLERGRFRLSLPLNLAACAGFIAASHLVNSRTSAAEGSVIIFRQQFGSASAPGNPETTEFFKDVSTNVAQPQIADNRPSGNPTNHFLSGLVIRGQRDLSDLGLTNLLAELPQGVKPPLPPPGALRFGLFSMLLDLLAYGAILGVAHSVHFYRRFRERERRALFLESNLANSRLHALRAQLHPHFLFNSLNAVATLVRRDPRLAETTLISLSELLRLALSQSERQEVPLREEMQFVQRYLEIQQTRFGDKLRVEQNIEPAALDCLVPTLLLQPLVENAIRHGLEPADNTGLVRVTAQRQNGLLVLTVEDDGIGLPDADEGQKVSILNSAGITPSASNGASGGTGIGLANLRARLETLYGPNQKLELIRRSDRGVTVLIQIPWWPVKALESPNGNQ